MDQRKRIESEAISRCYWSMFFHKSAKTIQWGKDSLSINGKRIFRGPHAKNSFIPLPYTIYQHQLTWEQGQPMGMHLYGHTRPYACFNALLSQFWSSQRFVIKGPPLWLLWSSTNCVASCVRVKMIKAFQRIYRT